MNLPISEPAGLCEPAVATGRCLSRHSTRETTGVAPVAPQANDAWEGVARRHFHRRGSPLVALIGDRYNRSVTDPFAPSPDGQLSRPPAHVPAGKRRRTKESEGGLFAAFAAFWGTQMLDFQPVSQLLPEYEHTVTALTGLLAAAVTYPLATWWLKRLPCQTHASGRR